MKKTFYFEVANKKRERQVEAIRAEIKKYLARERRKPLKDGVDFWDFACKIGEDAERAQPIKETEIKPTLNKYYLAEKKSFYLEILAQPGFKAPRQKTHNDDEHH